jgi:pimeloyl-ACP methyl ester carboxylesterase
MLEMKRVWGVGLVVLSMVMVSGCGDDDGDGGSDNSDFAVDELEFGSCPSTLPGFSKGRRCATAALPLHYDDPNGKKIDVMVARYLASGTSRGQLWMLDGGPGGTGAGYMSEEVLAIYSNLGLDIYVPQHRGTGHSTPLRCDEPDDLVACGKQVVDEWGDDLSGFNSMAAAEDLGHLIPAARKNEEPVYVLGISYGSFWGQRYLQRYPSQATGVLLEGIVPLDENLYDADPLADAAGLRMLTDCSEDEACRAALDGDPEATAREVLAIADDETKRCGLADGFNRRDTSSIITMMMVLGISELVPATLLRLNRCSAQDITELTNFVEVVEEVVSVLSELDWETDNPVLGAHVLRTDLLAEVVGIPLDKLVAVREKLIFENGGTSPEYVDYLVNSWPVNYAPMRDDIARPEAPVLLTNGGYDMQTPLPWIDEVADTLDATAIVFPTAGHGVDMTLAAALETNEPCSIKIKKQFVDDPTATLDQSCLDELPTPDFSGKTEIIKRFSMMFFGTPETLSDGETPTTSALVRGTMAYAEVARDEILEMIVERIRRLPQGKRRFSEIRGH